jgi:hypothetical protein
VPLMVPSFPKRRSDGSFCIEVRLRVDSQQLDVLANRLNAWLDQWVLANRFWKWSLAKRAGGLLDFLDDFVGPPAVVVRTPAFICLRFECRPQAKKWWKDWLVLRILKDIHAAFDEVIAVENIGDCPSSLAKNNPVAQLPRA